ncbi:trace amine-associated receptor 8b-like [Stylophora pistillata]|uniref:trace amine-associated receptor 8b-like n=1 Tax=Stylophora pistillata TaxID=50429 RepID=UPI000C03FBE8|nr:trace amine-associated receptor 8b-like [Stylophora pistillata]
MATNRSNITLEKTNEEDWTPVPASHCISWLVVFGIECLAVVILNAITFIVFVKQRQLHRKSTYLIINLAIVDFFVGAVNGPLLIELFGSSFCDLWESVRPDSFWLLISEISLGHNIYKNSFLNLAFISLERAHATFRPFKHRFVEKWVYGVMISVTWLVPVVMTATYYGLLIRFHLGAKIISAYFSYFSIHLFVIFVCYVSIFIKVRRRRLPRHHGAASLRERKLTSTLFLITFESLLTLLPGVVYYGLESFNSKLRLAFSNPIYIYMVLSTLNVLNSLINPITYAIVMPELRAGILQIIFRRAPRGSNAVNIPLQDRSFIC